AQDTPARRLLVAPVRLGVGWIDHRLPFQRSANAPCVSDPTAVHTVVVGHETPSRMMPAGVGVCWIVQRQPAQRSASAPWLPSLPSTTAPTAVHAYTDAHDTALSPAEPRIWGLGDCYRVHLMPFQRSTRVG